MGELEPDLLEHQLRYVTSAQTTPPPHPSSPILLRSVIISSKRQSIPKRIRRNRPPLIIDFDKFGTFSTADIFRHSIVQLTQVTLMTKTTQTPWKQLEQLIVGSQVLHKTDLFPTTCLVLLSTIRQDFDQFFGLFINIYRLSLHPHPRPFSSKDSSFTLFLTILQFL